MKKSISILFCLFMFPLFLNTSQVNAQSSIPSCLSFQSGDHAARIECFQKNEKEFRARIIELRRKHNIEQVNYDSFGESCPSRSPGDHAARLECFKNNDNAYQAIINELMATKEGSAVDFNNEAKRFQESTTEGQHIQQLEAKISDLEGKLTNAVSPTVYDDAVRLNKEQQAQLEADRIIIEADKQGRDALTSLLQESRAKHLASEASNSQLEIELAGSRKSLEYSMDGLPSTHQLRIQGTNICADYQLRNNKACDEGSNGWMRNQVTPWKQRFQGDKPPTKEQREEAEAQRRVCVKRGTVYNPSLGYCN